MTPPVRTRPRWYQIALSLCLFLPGGSCSGEKDPPAPAGNDAYTRSLEFARLALARRPEEPRLLQVLGDIHHRRGKFASACDAYRRAIEKEPRSFEALDGLGRASFQLGRHEEALAAFRRLVEIAPPPQVSPVRARVAEAFYETGRYAEAVKELRAVLAAGVAEAEVFYQLGKALDARARELMKTTAAGAEEEARKAEVEAIDALRRAVSSQSTHHGALYLLGTVHRRRGEERAAQEALEAFRRHKPEDPGLAADASEKAEQQFEVQSALQLARALFECGDAEGALDLLGRALAGVPDHPKMLAYRGWVLLRLSRFQEAASAYEAALVTDPESADCLWNLGKVRIAQGDFSRAAPLLLRATAIRRDFAEGWELLSQLALEKGIYHERAEEFARQALRLRPSSKNYSSLAMALFSQGRMVESERVLAEGLSRFPEDPDLRTGLRAIQAAASGR